MYEMLNTRRYVTTPPAYVETFYLFNPYYINFNFLALRALISFVLP